MLNTTNIRMGSTTSNVTFNQTSIGMMQRSNPKSYFLRFHKGSPMAKQIFPTSGKSPYVERKVNHSYEEEIKIAVLQILVFGEDEFLIEAIDIVNLTEESDGNYETQQ